MRPAPVFGGRLTLRTMLLFVAAGDEVAAGAEMLSDEALLFSLDYLIVFSGSTVT